MIIKKLDDLTVEVLKKYTAWKIVTESYSNYEFIVTPAERDQNNAISKTVGDVWCFTEAIFANGDKKIACSLCRGDDDVGPILWSVWNDLEFVVLNVPPAPRFVLKVDGPLPFSEAFNKTPDEVFPILFKVVPHFETLPTERSVTIYKNGKTI